MARKCMIVKETVREKRSRRARNSKKRKELKNIILSSTASYEEKLEAVIKLNKRRDSPTKHQRRCTQCGRARAVYRKFRLCRIHLREAAMRGDVPGLVKASW